MHRSFAVAMAVWFCVAPIALAQADRYDVGRKLIAFEEAWDRQTDAAARKRTLPHLNTALTSFFANRYGEAGRSLDAARRALASEQPATPERVWAEAHVFRPESRMVDTALKAVWYTLTPLYDPKVDRPDRVIVRVQLVDDTGKPLSRPPLLIADSLPLKSGIPLNETPEGDHCLVCELQGFGKESVSTFHSIALIKDPHDRIKALAAVVEKLPETGLTTEQRTLKSLTKWLSSMARGVLTPETNLPACRLLSEAEALATLPSGGKYYGPDKSGQFWLTLATDKGSAPVRLFVPPQAKAGKPLPLVVALHGAGGTENMYFDAYGHGEIVRQCEKRGWFLVATRTDLFATPPVAAVVDALAQRYPLDQTKVFLVGHSMGAGQAIALAQQSPERWAGIAALGGGGRVRATDGLKKASFFVGCGSEDFALGGARALTKSLEHAGVTNVKYVEYPDIEHIVVVQVALPEVFRWYDELIKR